MLLTTEILDLNLADLGFGIAHRIRNPLGITKSNMQALLDNALPHSEEHERIKIVLNQIQILENKLENIKQITHPIQPLIKNCSLENIFKKFQEQNQLTCQKQKINLQISLTEKNKIIETDEKLLIEAMNHLTQNAIESMPTGGKISITYLNEPEFPTIDLLISNDGAGIDSDTFQHLGEPFFSTKTNALGLGLARTRRIIAALHGKLRLTSIAQQGTTATLSLPKKP